jgi:hypothetical protein
MDGHEQIDASLDREIASMLASEPSPEFLARVRARVAEEPEPRGWRAPWMFAVAGAVVAVIVAVLAWPERGITPPNDASIEQSEIVETAEATPRPPIPSAPVERELPTAVKAVVSAAQPERPIDIDLPEVVIADNEVQTFAALVTSIRQRRFDAAVPAAPNPDTPLEIKELPPVEPLEIEPIVKLAALQAEGERP